MRELKHKNIAVRQKFSNIIRALMIIRKLFPWYLTLSSAKSILTALQPLIVIYFSARIISELENLRDISLITIYVVIVVGSTFFARIINNIIGRKIEVFDNARWEIMQRFKGERYARMDYEYVEDSHVNELLADMTAKEGANGLGIIRMCWLMPTFIERLCGVIASVFMMLGVFNITFSIAGSFITSIWSTALLILSIFIPIVLRILLMKRSIKIMERVFKMIPKLNTIFGYYFRYIQTNGAGKDLRIYNQQPSIIAQLKENSMEWLINMSRMESETASITAAANAVVSGFTYILIGLRALAGMYGIGQVTQYVGAVTSFSSNLTGLISNCAMIWENAAYLPMLYEFLDLPDSKYMGTLTTEKRADNEYELEFHNVSFKYPGTEDYALKNLNLKLNIGERLAVVGMNGSGKTTMIKLLCRLYDPTEGEITLNGIDIRKYDYDEYMCIFSVVFQDFKLLSFPLGQNVAASFNIDKNKAVDCLRKAGFHDRLDSLENGLDTCLYKDYEEDGVEISGGEAQKIALARALYKFAPFVILDEPTAALDPIAEYEIYSKFDSIVGDKTAVYISHRLSSCRFCNDIAVFHEGELIQRGSHDELVTDKTGKYYELWNAQAQYYTETGVKV